MSIRVKSRGGTVTNGDPTLCLSCKFATIVKGPSLRDEVVECGQLAYGHGRITFPVTSCNVYVERGHPSIREMEEIAWVLRSNPKKNEIGFVKASTLRLRDRFVLAEDD